jgi:prepilin-type N-terminal cleavage/methylation domain-containing protein
LRKLLRKLPKNNQNGFTLIELLVVISILGILAAVVTMSMVGITSVAQKRAAATELQTVQVAMDTMLADQGVDQSKSCDGAPGTAAAASSDMTKFPSAAAYQLDNTQSPPRPIPSHDIVSLYPYYLHEQTTHGTYICTGVGQISQVAYTP